MSYPNRPSPLEGEPCGGSRPVVRAGLRNAPRLDAPTGVFAVVEISVLVFVAALAMVSIIVSLDDADAHQPVASSAAASPLRTADLPQRDAVSRLEATDAAGQ